MFTVVVLIAVVAIVVLAVAVVVVVVFNSAPRWNVCPKLRYLKIQISGECVGRFEVSASVSISEGHVQSTLLAAGVAQNQDLVPPCCMQSIQAYVFSCGMVMLILTFAISLQRGHHFRHGTNI